MEIAKYTFVGGRGLRPGWGLLLFSGLLTFLFGATLFSLKQLAPGLLHTVNNPSGGFLATPSRSLLLFQSAKIVLLLAATSAIAAIERKSIWAYGLAGFHPIRSFGGGVGCGFAALSLVVGLLLATSHIVFGGPALQGETIVGYALFWALNFFLVGFYEENLLRGYVQHTLARGIGFWPAAFCTSVIFGLTHISNSGETLAGIVQVILAGLIFCAGLRLTGSLWWSIGFHTAWNWSQSFLYGTLNSGIPANGHWLSSIPYGDPRLSGGDVGPEGSVVCIAVQFAIFAAMVVMLIRRPRTR